MAFINGKEVLFSARVNITNESGEGDDIGSAISIASIDTIYSSANELPEGTADDNGKRLVVINAEERCCYSFVWDSQVNTGGWVKGCELNPNVAYLVLTGEKTGLYRYTTEEPYFVSSETNPQEGCEDKLDKITEPNKIYGTDENGNQKTYAVSERQTAGVAIRESDGQILLPSEPTRGTSAVSKSYADKKVSKTTTPSRVYGTNANGEQTQVEYTPNVVADSVAQRTWDGQLYIAKNPNESPHCATSRHYVDGLVNPLEERVSDLESLTLTFTEDKATAYNKSVPASVGKYALIKSIGGATKVGINGEIPFGLADETGITIDQLKGTYTFKIQPNAERQFLIGQFPANTHLFLEFSYTETGGQVSNVVICLADGDGNVKDGFIEANSAFCTDDTYTHLSLNFENYDYYEEGNTTEVTVTAKIKVGYAGFINAEVSEIKSIGADGRTLIDTFTIPVEEIKERVDGYGLEKNYIRCIDGKFEFVQIRKKAILNSTKYWEKYYTLTDKGVTAYILYINDNKGGFETSVCNAFEYRHTAWLYGSEGQYSEHPTLTNMYFCTDKATLAEWKAWLDAKEASGNPVILEYELATPIVTDITDLFKEGNKIEVQQGGTLIPVNTNEMPVPTTIAYVKRKE